MKFRKVISSYIREATIVTNIEGETFLKSVHVDLDDGVKITPIGEGHDKVLPEEWDHVHSFIREQHNRMKD